MSSFPPIGPPDDTDVDLGPAPRSPSLPDDAFFTVPIVEGDDD